LEDRQVGFTDCRECCRLPSECCGWYTGIVKGIDDAKAHFRSLADPRALNTGATDGGHQTRAQGATLQELAYSYNVGISTIRRNPRAG
jgi:hypothetical protein